VKHAHTLPRHHFQSSAAYAVDAMKPAHHCPSRIIEAALPVLLLLLLLLLGMVLPQVLLPYACTCNVFKDEKTTK
jgi:hypothetical protein